MGRLAERGRTDREGRRLSARLRVTIAAVGRFRSGPERALFQHFRDRVVWPVTLREIDAAGSAPSGRREAELLMAACPAGAPRIALDAGGAPLSSAAFARRLGAWRDAGERRVAFLIGGPEGLDPALVARCHLTLSYGAATWPHLLVRGMLMEQIYRAQQILAGHPYHRGGRG